jgi:hypothetical protein
VDKGDFDIFGDTENWTNVVVEKKKRKKRKVELTEKEKAELESK